MGKIKIQKEIKEILKRILKAPDPPTYWDWEDDDEEIEEKEKEDEEIVAEIIEEIEDEEIEEEEEIKDEELEDEEIKVEENSQKYDKIVWKPKMAILRKWLLSNGNDEDIDNQDANVVDEPRILYVDEIPSEMFRNFICIVK